MDIAAIFGCRVFNDCEMRRRLPKNIYTSLKNTRRLGATLDPAIADVVANAMKDWAIDQGATHYSHWFAPMNNFTAGKHDSFLSTAEDGKVILEFSRSALVRGEPDASSFPSGGLRATFEARGYTAWDPTSPAFVKDGTLYIPTAFCSYTGEALDTKTPLLRSMQAVSREGIRLLRAIGNTTSTSVIPTVGAEQEYFLIDRKYYEDRLDLKLCGRTLLGSKPPKGQELDDHYCARIKLRVAAFMKELDEELWSFGIASKTKHNEAAPAQHELAPIFSTCNIACDHNQLTMETMRVVAKKHNLACLLYEKPFDGINGSGKHNNYALCTDDGINLLRPSKHPEDNLQFLLILAAFVRAVDLYSDLLSMSAACPGNDRRLGSCEAPPAIISIFLGGQLSGILEDIQRGVSSLASTGHYLKTGVDVIPELRKDESDRNRTSPFAFTGNKFEFRMVGSSQSISYANIVLNTIMADTFGFFAEQLEAAEEKEKAIREMIAETMRTHSKIIFNGNNYTTEWVEEARRRGLPIVGSSVEAFRALNNAKNVQLFERLGVFSPVECQSRYEILLENYSKTVSIEASTLLEMLNRQIIPASISACGQLATDYNALAQAGIANLEVKARLERLSQLTTQLMENTQNLQCICNARDTSSPLYSQALYINRDICAAMEQVRISADALECIVNKAIWPIPTYTDLLHRL